MEAEESKNSKLSEVERIQKEFKKVESERNQLKLERDKNSGWLKAKSQIGDGFAIEDEEDGFQLWMKFQYNPETNETDAIRFLNAIKKPLKNDVQQVINIGPTSLIEKHPLDYTPTELVSLEETDKARYDIVAAERKKLLKTTEKRKRV